MPYSLILQTVFFLALGTAVVVIARALPRVEDEMAAHRSFKGRLETLAGKVPVEKMDEFLNLFFHKILRRLKIVILKADNIVTSKLHLMKDSGKRRGPDLPSTNNES
ncbi:MAG: hypothetical protein PHG66_03890 [Candidatus Colwellbacteria bacterium]|nr:hypothetical protein [Candidatus Colwellbacteria bacterium]